jgi:hypothetical protein
MAELQLGRAEDVQEWLAKAVQQAEQELAADETSWNRRATLELLRDEATALVPRSHRGVTYSPTQHLPPLAATLPMNSTFRDTRHQTTELRDTP